MTILANGVIALVVLLHIYFLVLEMFLWTKPAGMRVFRTTSEFAKQSAGLAKNQGLYNGFLAAGLVWGLSLGDGGYAVKLFFLICVSIAGIYGAATINKRILYVQGVPAIVGIALVMLSRR